MPRFPRPKAADLIAIALSLLATAGSAWAAAAVVGSEEGVIVSANGKTYAYPIEKDATLSFRGPLGETIVVVEDGTVRIASSPCAEKLCISEGGFSEGGQWVACLPNKVMVRIAGKGANIDAATF